MSAYVRLRTYQAAAYEPVRRYFRATPTHQCPELARRIQRISVAAYATELARCMQGSWRAALLSLFKELLVYAALSY